MPFPLPSLPLQPLDGGLPPDPSSPSERLLDPPRIRLAALLAESARLRHASLDLRKLDDPRKRPAPAATERAAQELSSLLTEADRTAERLTRQGVVLPCSTATIRQSEAAFAQAEAAGLIPPCPQGDHPGLLVLRFATGEASPELSEQVQALAFGETEAFTLHATAPAAYRADPGLRMERVAGLRASLLLVVRPTPGPEGAALLAQLADGATVFLSARPDRHPTLRRSTALKRLLTRWESTHLPLLNLFNPDPRSWGEAQALNAGEDTAAWHLLGTGETSAREFVRKAIGSPDFALLEATPSPARLRAATELVLQCLSRGQRVLLTGEADETAALVAAVRAHPVGGRLVAPLRFLACGETYGAQDAPTYEARVTDLMRAGPTLLKREEAERVALDAANLVFGSREGLSRHPMLRPAQLARDATDFDHLIVLSAERLAFRDFLPLAVHATKATLLGTRAGQASDPSLRELADLAADEAERAGRFAELQAELAYKACVGKDGSADDEDAELADVHGRRKVLLILETPGDAAKALATATRYLRERQLTVATCTEADATLTQWASPAPEVNVIATTRAVVERTDFLALLSTDFRLVVTDASADLLAPLAVRMKAPKTRGRSAQARPLIRLSWSQRTAENLRGMHAHRFDDQARGESVRALLLDLRSIFPFEKSLWEPNALLALKERTLATAFEVLHDGVRADTGAGRSELAYHSGLPRPGSLASRKEVLR